MRKIIYDAFARLAIADPDGHVLDAIAAYPLSSVVDGIATFEGKRAAGSLPRDLELPGRYLLAIVRNLANEREAELISDAMLRARLEAQDALLAVLLDRRRAIDEQATPVTETLSGLIDNAFATDLRLDRLFWVSEAGDLIRHAPAADRPALFRLGARRVNTAIRVPYRERQAATRWLAHTALPLD